jgi:hypothetical protein
VSHQCLARNRFLKFMHSYALIQLFKKYFSVRCLLLSSTGLWVM